MPFYYLLILLFQSVKSTVFSVPHELTGLFIAEENIVRLISTDHEKSENADEYFLSWRSRFNELIPKIKDEESPEVFNETFHRLYNGVIIKIEERSEDEYVEAVLERLVGNPVHVYTLLDRLVNMLPWVRAGLSKEMDSEIEEIMGSLQVPDDSDVEGACQALVRIQFAYRLDPVSMSRGHLLGTDTQARLTPGQMMDIARRRQSGLQPLRPQLKAELALAILWAEAALSLTEDEDERIEMEMFLGLARMEHNNNWVDPAGKRGNSNEEFFVRKIEEGDTGLSLREEEKLLLVNATNDSWSKQDFNLHDFYSLCRGEPAAQSCAPARPLCHVSTNQQPYLTLAPLRVETICEEPSLVIFHDILTHQEMAYMKSNVLKDLMVATVVDRSVESGKRVSNERTQSSGWLWDTDHELLNKLSKKTEVFTNLAITPRLDSDPYRTFASEPWQIGLYGSGGHYLPHFDAFDVFPDDDYRNKEDNYWVGNRIATVMFYLSDLKGGFTAFPEMGVAARPRAGSAVFWYNLDRRQHERDARSLHGGCPTALGIKWVSNKWIRQGAQIWGKNCPLD